MRRPLLQAQCPRGVWGPGCLRLCGWGRGAPQTTTGRGDCCGHGRALWADTDGVSLQEHTSASVQWTQCPGQPEGWLRDCAHSCRGDRGPGQLVSWPVGGSLQAPSVNAPPPPWEAGFPGDLPPPAMKRCVCSPWAQSEGLQCRRIPHSYSTGPVSCPPPTPHGGLNRPKGVRLVTSSWGGSIQA